MSHTPNLALEKPTQHYLKTYKSGHTDLQSGMPLTNLNLPGFQLRLDAPNGLPTGPPARGQ